MSGDITSNEMSLEEQQKAAIQKFLDEQSEFDAQFRDHHASLLDQTKRMRESMMANLQAKNKQMSPEVQEIAVTLMQQPILIPHVKKFIADKLAAIEQAIQGVLS